MTVPAHLQHLRLSHPIEHICEDCGERTVVTPEQIDAFLEQPVFCCSVCQGHEIPMAALGGIAVGADPLEGICANCAAISKSRAK